MGIKSPKELAEGVINRSDPMFLSLEIAEDMEYLAKCCLELLDGYKRLQDASDIEMKDGDLAREIAEDMIGTTYKTSPSKS